MVKCVCWMLLKGLQGSISSICKFFELLLSCPHYPCVNKRAKMVNVTFKRFCFLI
ncbi:transposase [Candidatus Enterovibrio altilux]|uniref:Mobile element protein n=1 Tax=Candidatus Enterovibrio altilux TaxID=1927128 RepID=A0A291B7W2_9GAMM|nr:transposase [Candidatus Enterovibrio luxaltus]ATF09081.1 Mobile element protein [Candidatus Enterovibrio luxaltus]